jgi:hypothetical protein
LRVRAGLQPGDEILQAQLLQPLSDRLQLGGAQLDEAAALAAQLERLAQTGLAGVQAPDDLLQPRGSGLVARRLVRLGHRRL